MEYSSIVIFLPFILELGLLLPKEEAGRGALECNLTGRCPFFKTLHNLFAFRYPVAELLDYKNFQKQ